MSGNSAAQQNLADRLDDALRRYEREGGDLNKLAERVGQERRDLTRWRQGTTLPGHVLIALIDELPRHLADHLIGATRLRLASKDAGSGASAIKAAAATSSFSADVTERMSDGEWCHQDDAAAKEHARRAISHLQNFAGE